MHTHIQQLSRSQKKALSKKRKREEKKAVAAVTPDANQNGGNAGSKKKQKPKMTKEERRAKFLRPKKSNRPGSFKRKKVRKMFYYGAYSAACLFVLPP